MMLTKTPTLFTHTAVVEAVKLSAKTHSYRTDLTNSENHENWERACEEYDNQGGSYADPDNAIMAIVSIATRR